MMELHHMMTFHHMTSFYLGYDGLQKILKYNAMYDGGPSHNDAHPSQTL